MPREKEEQKRIKEIRPRFIQGYEEKDFSYDELVYERVVEDCRIANTTFHDSEFQHNKNINLDRATLWGCLKNSCSREPKLEWIRPVVAFPQPVLDFERPGVRIADRYDPWILLDDPKGSDVHQTGIGDCCLVAALSVIAEQPAILDRIFPRKEVSEYGVYEVRLCNSGEWKSYLVDDWLLARGDKLITARTENNQLWVSLIEKAIAKTYGGYDKIRGINKTESFTLLTGFPARQFLFFDYTDNEVWEMLISARTAGDLMVAGSNDETIPMNNQLHLNPRHAYSLLDVAVFDGHRLIRLRDPHGLGMWAGKWGPLWKGWHEYDFEKRVELNGSILKTFVMGEFWMGFDEFLKYFVIVTICKNRPNWYTTCVKTVVGGQIDDQSKAIRITVHEKCQVCFSAYSEFGTKEERAMTLICIHRLCETGEVGEVIGVFYLHGGSGSSSDVLLESGSYVVMPMQSGIEKAERNIVIHSSTPLDAHLIPLNPTVMVDCVQKFIQKSGRPVKLNIPSASIQKHWLSNEAMMILAENRSSNQYLHVNIYYQRHEFDYCSTRPQFFDSQEDTIPPMSRQIILILVRPKMEKIDLEIDLEYSMDSEQFGKYGRRNKRSHIPEIHRHDYIHHVLPIDNDYLFED